MSDKQTGSLWGAVGTGATQDERAEQLTSEVADLRRQLAIALAKVRELEALAEADTLTPVGNRRLFVRKLEGAISDEDDSPTAVLFVDVNGLKAINDVYGHSAGDAALIHVARTLAANIRASDTVARLGGDEFGVVLRHSTPECARTRGEQLAAAIAAHPVRHGDKLVPVTVAVGVYPLAPGEDQLAILARADAAMYARKRSAKLRPKSEPEHEESTHTPSY